VIWSLAHELLEHAEYVVLAQNQVVIAIDLDFAA
jgi:hypothetical protein